MNLPTWLKRMGIPLLSCASTRSVFTDLNRTSSRASTGAQRSNWRPHSEMLSTHGKLPALGGLAFSEMTAVAPTSLAPARPEDLRS